ncbi:MAG: peptide chain release factor aRF-1 [Crenarchaeota archaeon]|nr:peptide chain release factor aRF-1 [Thermoproteota archaeon]
MPRVDMSDWDINDPATRRKIARIVNLLKSKTSYDGHSTTLVSIWIAPGTPTSEITSLINQELATAARIKSRTTRKHVQAALRSISSKFKAWTQIPPNGLLIFCGWTQQSNDLEYWEIIPPLQIQKKLYTCDSIFRVEVLEELLKVRQTYGIIIVERDESTIGILQGSAIKVLKHIETPTHGKHRKGGQSEKRFERQIESVYEYHLKKTADEANKVFLPMLDTLNGIIVAGPAFSKEDFVKLGELDYRLHQKIVGLVSAQYQDLEGLREAVNNALDIIKETEYAKQKRAYDELMEAMGKYADKVVVGFQETLRALREGRLEKIYVAEDLDKPIIKVRCGDKVERFLLVDNIGDLEKVTKDVCKNIGDPSAEVIDESFINYILDEASTTATHVVIISQDELRGQLKSGLGGIAGILRF